MYADPFWMERYGERGRHHAQTDGRYHIAYLTEALVAGEPALFATYACWLRDLLVARGMCSRHLEDNFVRLGAAIAAEAWTDSARALDVLDHGVRALLHTAGPAQPIDRVRPRLAVEAAALAGGATSHELAVVLSYLTDALVAGSPDRLRGYIAHLREVGRADGLDAICDALSTVLTANLPAADARAALACLSAACELTGPPARGSS
jgi:hypothetical protein